VPQAFDSLIGKLIITGADREQALQRSRRALAEFTVGGMPTVLPFHRAVVNDPAFTGEPFSVFTRWIETEFTTELEPQDLVPAAEADAERQRLTVEVGGKRLEVTLPATLGFRAAHSSTPGSTPAGGTSRSAGRRARGGGPKASGDSLVTPMQGTIVKIVAVDGQQVNADETVVVLEAMKMEQPLKAHKAGTISGLSVEVGQTVTSGTEICQIKD
jgi:acetyl-CoA/propionyl-CoA carboxylase biotin carboxyl carrier protein